MKADRSIGRSGQQRRRNKGKKNRKRDGYREGWVGEGREKEI